MIQLTVTSLQKQYGRNIVFDGLSFDSGPGILGVSGHNGSGKSTLLKCLAGILKPTSGTVLWKKEGNNISPADLKKKIGYAAPYINLYEELTVWENLEFILNVRSSPFHNRISSTLAELDCTVFSHSLFGSLSTGQQQRVRLAAAIIHQPEMLFLDEPGSNLDEKGRANVASIVQSFRNSKGFLILASNTTEELGLCDHIIDLNS